MARICALTPLGGSQCRTANQQPALFFRLFMPAAKITPLGCPTAQRGQSTHAGKRRAEIHFAARMDDLTPLGYRP